jgi:hypothetical protein
MVHAKNKIIIHVLVVLYLFKEFISFSNYDKLLWHVKQAVAFLSLSASYTTQYTIEPNESINSD